MDISITKEKVKEPFKQAIFEVLNERKEMVYDIFADVLEDFALVKAIKEGESSERVNKKQVFKTLKGTP